MVSLSVLAPEELPADSQVVNFTVCDYWGAEQMAPAKVALTEVAKQGDNFAYEGSIDLANVPLEGGKYYEMIAKSRCRISRFAITRVSRSCPRP